MNNHAITMARVYDLESKGHIDAALTILQNQAKIKGVTIIRGISGYGADGEIRTSSLLSLSLDLPIIIEFYDSPDKVSQAIQLLKANLELAHIVSWSAHCH